MEWIERFTGAVDYIERNLDGEVELGQAAKIALCSPYHFSRMFSYITGITLGEYLRRRRMSAAALELASSDVKVVDLALRYGYDSPTAFNRAFQSVHGLPPSAARQAGATLKAYPRIVFSLAIKGDAEMNYRIEEKAAFRVVGPKRTYPMNVEQTFKDVPQFWAEASGAGTLAQLLALNDTAPHGVLGLSVSDTKGGWEGPGATFDYMVGAASTRPAPEGMQTLQVPAATWAVFPGDGPMPDAMQAITQRIMTEWLPVSGYDYGPGPDAELYLAEARADGTMPFEVWIPVVKKG